MSDPRTPITWDPMVEPPVEQFAEWLRICTPVEREEYVTRARDAFRASQDCFMTEHVRLGDVLAALHGVKAAAR